jgi:hypothetical protein
MDGTYLYFQKKHKIKKFIFPQGKIVFPKIVPVGLQGARLVDFQGARRAKQPCKAPDARYKPNKACKTYKTPKNFPAGHLLKGRRQTEYI